MPILDRKTNWSEVDIGDRCIIDDCQGIMKIVQRPSTIYCLECDKDHNHGRIATNQEIDKYHEEVESNG